MGREGEILKKKNFFFKFWRIPNKVIHLLINLSFFFILNILNKHY